MPPAVEAQAATDDIAVKIHLATLTYDTLSHTFNVKCQEPGCTRPSHNNPYKHEFLGFARVMRRDGSFGSIMNLAFKHDRMPNGDRILRNNTDAIR
nr:hypothetical protein TetV2_00112 [Oceanusvirus sp.]